MNILIVLQVNTKGSFRVDFLCETRNCTVLVQFKVPMTHLRQRNAISVRLFSIICNFSFLHSLFYQFVSTFYERVIYCTGRNYRRQSILETTRDHCIHIYINVVMPSLLILSLNSFFSRSCFVSELARSTLESDQS